MDFTTLRTFFFLHNFVTTLRALVTNFSHVKKKRRKYMLGYFCIRYIYCDHNEKFKY